MQCDRAKGKRLFIEGTEDLREAMKNDERWIVERKLSCTKETVELKKYVKK